MPTSREIDPAPVFDGLDEIMDNAYFTPLALGDALAVQLKNPGLKGLSLETVKAVFRMMDRFARRGEEAGADPVAIGEEFMEELRRNFPEVQRKWTAADPNLVVEPEMAFRVVLSRGEGLIDSWLAGLEEPTDSGSLSRIRGKALAEIMDGFDPRKHPDDVAWRRYLREEALADYPVWAGPAVYLDAWSEYVRGIMDLSPSPATRSVWPY